jgi:phosphatidate cytidylyltransferase
VLRQRLIFGASISLALLALLAADAYAGKHAPGAIWVGLPTTALGLLFGLLTARELLSFSHARGVRPLPGVTYIFTVGFVVGPWLAAQAHSAWLGGGMMMWAVGALIAAFIAQVVRRSSEQALTNIAATVFMTLYAGALPAFLARLRLEAGGTAGVALLVLTVLCLKINDTAAYFTGRSLGRHKLIPWLSPGKTWEGFAGGLTAAVVAAFALGGWFHAAGIVPMGAGVFGYPLGLLIFGLLMGLASVAGDLSASMLKRDAGVKDSGRIVPGMGGALDLFDSILFGAPLAWWFWMRLAA